MRPRRSWTLRCAVTCVLVLRVALAEEGDAPGSAEELFREGRDALKRGEVALACARFAESQRREPAKGTLLNLALCLEEARRLLEAREQLRRLLDWADLDEARRALAKEHLALVEKRIPHLVLQLDAGALDGTTLLLDGRELASPLVGAPIALDPGPHVLRVVRPGALPRDVPFELREGTDFLLSELPRAGQVPPPAFVSPPAPPLAPLAPPAKAAPATEASVSPAAYVLGGLGLLGLAVGTVTGILVIDRARTVDAHCEDKLCDQEGLSAGESGRTLSTVSTVSFAAGVGLTAVGVYLLLGAPDAPPPAASSLDVAPRGASVGAMGRF